jgi:G:T-mismatch repair DNA endonuclease (very short patch repair protein)
MRGKAHSAETKARLSEVKREQYRQGKVRVRRYKLSAAEKAIAAFLTAEGFNIKQQFHIRGVPFLYDIFLPDLNLLIEYQGDYWHANPRKYPPGTTLNIFGKGPVQVDHIWARDAEKREAAVQAGYRVAYVWETDYQRDGLEAIRCILQEQG